MPIRYILLAITIVFLYFQVQSYTSNENTFNRTLKIYKSALLDKDYKTAIDYLYPKLYNEQTSKEQLYQKQKKIFEKSTIIDVQLTPELPMKTYSEGSYIVVKYSKTMTIDMLPLGTNEADKRARRMSLFFLKDSLNEGDTMKIDDNEQIIHIEKHGTLIFINPHQSGWKYLDVEATPKRLFKKILPIDIIDKEQVLILKQNDTMFQEIFQSKVKND